MPVISVIVPIYNSAAYLPDLVQSIQAQTMRDFEVIFINDGSTDGTALFLDNLETTDAFPTTVIHQQNSGVSAARNRGLEAAQGEYICFVDADDLLSPNYLELLLETMKEQDVSLVMGCMSRKLEDIVPDDNRPVRVYSIVDFCREYLYRGKRFSICCALFHQSLFTPEMRFVEGARYSEDVHLLWRLLIRLEEVAVVEKFIYYYRVNPSSAMGQVGLERRQAIELMEDLIPSVKKAVPAFAREFEHFAVARHHWSILWQAACSFSTYREFRTYYLNFSMRANLIHLLRYPGLLIVCSSALFLVWPRCYYWSVRGYRKGKERRKTG